MTEHVGKPQRRKATLITAAGLLAALALPSAAQAQWHGGGGGWHGGGGGWGGGWHGGGWGGWRGGGWGGGWGGGGVFFGIAPPVVVGPPVVYAPPPAYGYGYGYGPYCYAGPVTCPLGGPIAPGQPCSCPTPQGPIWGRVG